MHFYKNNKQLIILSLIVVLVISIGFLTLFISKLNTIKDLVEVINNKPVENSLSFNNNKEKYHNDEIETINYLAGNKNEYVYKDIHFLTSVNGWDEERLEEVAEEFFLNKHGEEMRYVEAVVINAGDGMYCYGNQEDIYIHYQAPITLFNFIPEDSKYNIAGKRSLLYVDNVSETLTTNDIAQSLSIAYGRHFVNYHMNIEGIEEDRDTEYFKLRANENDNIRLEITDNDDYINNYIWYLEEIAAHDYMFLMGSDNANRTLRGFVGARYYIDSVDEAYPAIAAYYRNARNITPHINVSLTLPDKVDGLSEYFYSFVNDDVPEYSGNQPMGDLNFKLKTKPSRSNFKKISYELSWDTPYDDDEILYSVIKYDMNDKVEVFQAHVIGNNEPSTLLDKSKNFRLYNTFYEYDMRTDQEFKIRIIASFPDGTITISEPLVVKYPDDKWED